jgi:hypothetical protein
MIVGVITGTYSSVFIAAAIVTFWRVKGAPRVPAAVPVAASAGGGRKKARKNGAS